MSDVGFVAILVAFFALAIFVVQLPGRTIDRDVDRTGSPTSRPRRPRRP
jgi:hypothetical protein